jgi:polyhydroxyalkanoate synthesis regulator phasin
MEQPDVNTMAEPSTATAAPEGFNPSDQYTWSPEQREHWNKTGNPPEQPKTQESAPASAPEKKAEPENAAEPGTAPKQEKKERKPGEKLNAEERISQLTAQVRRLEEEGRERSRPEEPKPPSQTTQQSPANYAEWRKAFKPAEWTDKWIRENPQSSFEDATAAMADHLYDVRRAYEHAEVQHKDAVRQAQEMLRAITEKHPDAESKIKQTVQQLFTNAPDFIKAFVNDSDVAADLLYSLSEPEALQKVLETAKTSPGKSLRMLRDMEVAFEKEISKPSVAPKSQEEVKPRAPKPPVEVGGRGAPPEDALVAAARAGDYRSFELEQNRRLTASHS